MAGFGSTIRFIALQAESQAAAGHAQVSGVASLSSRLLLITMTNVRHWNELASTHLEA